MNIGKALKRIRTDKEMTQVEVCKKIRMSQTYLSQLEKGNKKNPSKKVVEKLCKIYEVPIVAAVWMGTEEADIAPKKKSIYKQLKPAIDDLVSEFLK